MRTICLVLLVAAILAAAGSFITSPARAAETEVTIDNFTFAPERVSVKAGTIVTWINRDDIPHTVTSATGVLKSKALDTDDKFSFTFTTPGTYEYFCSLHPHMKATIVVEAATGQK